jgi:hypothetical protein
MVHDRTGLTCFLSILAVNNFFVFLGSWKTWNFGYFARKHRIAKAKKLTIYMFIFKEKKIPIFWRFYWFTKKFATLSVVDLFLLKKHVSTSSGDQLALSTNSNYNILTSLYFSVRLKSPPVKSSLCFLKS